MDFSLPPLTRLDVLRSGIEDAKKRFSEAVLSGDKSYIRRMHVQARDLGEKRSQDMALLYKKYARYFIDGAMLDPERIKPTLVEVCDDATADIFRLCRHTWSMPFSKGYGRRLRFIVMDDYHEAVMGILGMQSPPVDLACRDRIFDCPKDEKINRINATMDIYTVGSLPPYSDLLGGKLVAGLAACNEIRQAYEAQYGTSLVALTTTSAFGRSSMYNRLQYNGRLLAKPIGWTKGYGTVHLEHLYDNAVIFLKDLGVYKNGGFNAGSRVRWQNLAATIHHLGLHAHFLKHGLEREVFLYALIENLASFMKDGATPVFYDLPAQDYIDYWRHRWLLPRVKRMDAEGKNGWRRFKATRYFMGERVDAGITSIKIDEIIVGKRFRQDYGEIAALARSIDELGLLQPVGVTKDNRLIFGERRLMACRSLGMTEIPARVIDIDCVLAGEYAENEIRKDFSLKERVAIGQALEQELGERRGNPQLKTESIVENFPQLMGRKTRDIAAEKAGFGNAKTYGQAKAVAKNASEDLVKLVEQGKVGISTAAIVASALPKAEQNAMAAIGKREIIDAARRIKTEEKAGEKAVARCDGAWRLLSDDSVDLILTDPPSDMTRPLWRELAMFAAEKLTPNGVLIACSSQLYLYEVMTVLREHLDFYWMGALTYEENDQPTLFEQRKIINRWKPLLVFSKRGCVNADRIFCDRLALKDNWQQLIETFSQPGALVVDPFNRTRAVSIACEQSGRKFIGL